MDENGEESGSESSLDEEKSWEKQREQLGNPMADDYQVNLLIFQLLLLNNIFIFLESFKKQLQVQ